MIEIEWSDEFDRGSSWIAPKCVVGLDRDGVINEDLGTYCWKSKDFKLIEGSISAIVKLRKLGHKVVIITNQGGIEKGLFTENDVDNLHKHMFELFGEAGCQSIDGLYYSASSRKNDMYAKPNLGMFKRCEREVPHVKFNQGYYVGDKISDLKAAIKIGAKPILVRTGYGKETEELINKRFTYKQIRKATKVFDTLLDFVNYLAD